MGGGGDQVKEGKQESDSGRMSLTQRKVQDGTYGHNIEVVRVTTSFDAYLKFLLLQLKLLC